MRKWLVTGVSGGIGLALAKAALDRGDIVIGTARRDEDVAAFAAQITLLRVRVAQRFIYGRLFNPQQSF